MPLKNIANRVYVEAIDVFNNCRKTGIAATISVVIETDGTQSTIDAGASSGITEVGTTGVYMIPLTTSQMDGNTIAVITSTTTGNVIMEKAILYTEGGKLDTTVSSRLATSGYTAPTTPPTTSEITTAVWSGGTRTLTTSAPTVSEIWAAETRTLTASPTDISGLATAANLATVDTVVDAIAERMPSSGTVAKSSDIPTASQIATATIGMDVHSAANGSVGSLKTLVLMSMDAEISGSSLNVYDGNNLHTTLNIVSSDGEMSPVIGIREPE